MLKQLRHELVKQLWHTFQANTNETSCIETGLKARGEEGMVLDHFALIDLPGPHTGISQLQPLFKLLGYEEQGRDYLPSKQNDFCWLAPEDNASALAKAALPQIVIADFRLHEMPAQVANIIKRYAKEAKPLPITQLSAYIATHNTSAIPAILDLVLPYLKGRDWSLPTVEEFEVVHAFNELLAWVLVFGRQPNHFTYSVHLMKSFNGLNECLNFIEQDLSLQLNTDGGKIKGSRSTGIEQGSTTGTLQSVNLANGSVELPSRFIEFVWRHPKASCATTPRYFSDYFTGFIANHANRVIESLYLNTATTA